MWYEDASTAQLNVAYGGEHRLTDLDKSECFERLVIVNLIAGSLTPYLAQEWASKAHHYMRRHLVQQANEAHQREIQCDTPLLITTLLQSARLGFSVPDKGK